MTFAKLALALCIGLALVSCVSDDVDIQRGILEVEKLATPRSLATPQSLTAPRSLATPQGLATPSSLATPQSLTAPRSLATPQSLATPRSLVTPQSLTVPEGRGPSPTPDSAGAMSGAVAAEVVAEGLEVPWALAFPPDGRILVAERTGRIRVVLDGRLLEAPFAVLDVANVSESGLMGMALHPGFAENGHLFVCYTYWGDGGRPVNRVARLTDSGGAGVGHRVILDGIPGARNHDGCALGFGPDGKLYVTMGDAQEPERAQDLASLSGKVLRLDPDGGIPADNPFPGSPVYTYGHRNPQGLDWHPVTGELFITEHGPNSDDEINILQAGKNYGWPLALGETGDSRFVDPILSLTPTVALSGAAFYDGDTLPGEWDGDFIFAALRGSHLARVVLQGPDYRVVERTERLFDGKYGRLRAVAMSPDGHLYFTTSNRDGRGRPRPGDDKLLRLAWER